MLSMDMQLSRLDGWKGSRSALPQDGWTPLYSAAIGGHEGVVKLLLEAKAAVDAANMVNRLGGLCFGVCLYVCRGVDPLVLLADG
jgi:hypothetical protein